MMLEASQSMETKVISIHIYSSIDMDLFLDGGDLDFEDPDVLED